MASGIKDKVAIVGMGCSKFGERWDCGPEELILEAFDEAIKDAPVERNQIEMAWLGLFFQEQSAGKSGLPLSISLRLPNIPVTRVENMCATGTEALRGAVLCGRRGSLRCCYGGWSGETKRHGLSGSSREKQRNF